MYSFELIISGNKVHFFFKLHGDCCDLVSILRFGSTGTEIPELTVEFCEGVSRNICNRILTI